ncbi:trypsin-like peptidase domain-containing protein [Acaryochloris marina]|uniref:trypsin-like peptidase domain-containing protein n=1 Tax=Acaryochloris marina TaxID=155978 RepID=UPI0021C46A44|nr:trypsin-like peptidase domain-containing protein [Acaryochloris marina]BDM83056.1 hypothetical protein AM10699_59170 [Acaryochloris marina MBIC10699]
MRSLNSPAPLALGVIAFVFIPLPTAIALTATDVSAIAEAITVRIDGQNPGSGVLIKHQGNTYTVLTASHVVATEDTYELVTFDDQRYPLNYNRIQKFPGIDLAVVKFTSTISYRVAKLGDSSEVKAGESIYVSGFSTPTKAITEAIWNFSKGEVTSNTKRPLADGYGLVYSNNTLPGMSGGAILNRQGRLIGIHGRADAEQQVQQSATVHIKSGFNLGIPINTFLNLTNNTSQKLSDVDPPIAAKGSELKADDWYLQATHKSKKGDFLGAISDLDKAIELDPDYVIAYFRRGTARLNLKEYPKTIADLNKVIELDPEFAAAYVSRGISYTYLMKYSRAFSDYNKAIELNREFAAAYAIRGATYVLIGNLTQGKQDIQTAAQLFKQQNIPEGYEMTINFLKQPEFSR